MARPLSFDVLRATDKALLLFWQKGYQSTSLPLLLRVMGISRSSFYASFGNKTDLFISCLDLFADRTARILLEGCARRGAIEGLHFFLLRHLDGHDQRSARLGCLLVNTVLELSGVDDRLSQHASQHLGHIQLLFEQQLRQAGLTPFRARASAGLLMLVNEGVRVASRRGIAEREQRQSIAAALEPIHQEISNRKASA